ncbi:MAG TPA: DUF58 domain-containing protein [Phycisphaerae bacterium]|nr:DUF58 domain-containing protein [Phycisphaerae bacterium]HOI56205.1 DUF58 domain-containing protein [Phycisphaerae bacterium]
MHRMNTGAEQDRQGASSGANGAADASRPQVLATGYAALDDRARALFDTAFLQKLEYLRIVSRRAFAGLQPASRRGLRTGAGLEFAEHRPYAVGDDFRYLDWAAYGRLDKLLLRLFQQDEDLRIGLMTDTSGSMLTGRPPKVDFARRLTAALAYVGLANLDRIRVSAWGDGEVRSLRTRRGRGQIYAVLEFLASAPLGGGTNLALAARQFCQHATERGLVVVVSDFLGGAGHAESYEEGLALLDYHGHEVWALAVESPEDAAPPWQGDVELLDSETGAVRAVRLTPEQVARYQARRREFLHRFDAWTTERGIAHLRATSDADVADLVLDVFRRGGFIR